MTRRNPAVEERLARHLAATDYLVDGEAADDAWWASRLPKFREDYLAYAREVMAILKGPTIAAQAVANLDAEVRKLTRQRDRYRDAWHSACRGRARLRPPDTGKETVSARVAALREAADIAEEENRACKATTPCLPCSARTTVAIRLRRMADRTGR